jgi:serine/threonine-protein kinase
VTTGTGIPTQIGPYRIEREIARGGMGIVYLARDTRLDRTAAIKALPDDVASDPGRLARFEREAKTLASLNHPNIAGIYGVEESGGRRYLALEHVEGETLAARIARGPLPLAETLEICAQIAAGIEAAHESGVIHRDLKPGNVMITPGEHVKVLDFGLAKGKVAEPGSGPLVDSPTATDSPTLSSPTLPHSPTMHSPATLPGVILGTAAYLSPEQARGKAVDRRTDIWSFGCVLYECLTGKRAFEGETVSDTIAKILERDVDWGKLPKGTPPRIRELLQRCLEKDARKRLRDIGEARLAVEAVRAGATGATAPGAADAPPLPANPLIRAREAMRNHGYLFAAGLILGALIGINMFGHTGRNATGGVPTRVSVAIPSDIHFLGVGPALGGRAIVLIGSTKAGKDAQPVSRLYVRRLDRDTFEPIRGTDGVQGFVLSPDDRWILFVVTPSDQSTQVHTFKVPVDGSSPPASVSTADGRLSLMDGPAWLRSGDLIVSQDQGTAYARIKPNGGAVVRQKFDAPGFDGQLFTYGKALPGDRGVLLVSLLHEGGELRIGTGVLDLRTGKVKIIVKDGGAAVYSPTGHLLFARQGTLFAVPFDPDKLAATGEPVAILEGLYQPFNQFPGQFDLGNDGTLFYPPAGGAARNRHLVMIDRAGKVSDWSGEGKASEFWIFATRDGNRCATIVTGESSVSEIWVSDRGRPSRKLATNPGADAYGGSWSPDGTRIAYSQAARTEDEGIYIQSVDGTGPPLRVCGRSKSGTPLIETSWSPDGSTLLAFDNATTIYAIAIPPTPGTLSDPKPLFNDKAHRSIPFFSPDGRLIAYRSEETGTIETFVCRWDGRSAVGTPLQVSVGGGGTARWSRDGKRLYYDTPQSKLMAVDIVEAPVLRASAPSVAWDLDALRVANFRGVGHLFDFLPDGRMLVVRRAEGEGEPTQINVVLNFGEELKERMRAAAAK